MPKMTYNLVMSFASKVYDVVKMIPRGKVMSYKMVAESLDCKAYQAVGQALRKNPYAPIVPCHRVVASDGSLGGFMGKRSGRNIKEKMRMLKAEGVQVTNGKVDKNYFV